MRAGLERPLFVVKNGKLLIGPKDIDMIRTGKNTWNDLISKGLVEYFDAEEEETLLSLCVNGISLLNIPTWK